MIKAWLCPSDLWEPAARGCCPLPCLAPRPEVGYPHLKASIPTRGVMFLGSGAGMLIPEPLANSVPGPLPRSQLQVTPSPCPQISHLICFGANSSTFPAALKAWGRHNTAFIRKQLHLIFYFMSSFPSRATQYKAFPLKKTLPSPRCTYSSLHPQ